MSRNKPPHRPRQPADQRAETRRATRPDTRPSSRPEHRPARTPDGAVWLYGTHPVLAALANPARRLRRLLTTAEAARQNEAALRAIAQASPRIEEVERAEIERLLPPGAVHQGLAVLAASLESPSVEEIAASCADADSAVVLVLDQVTDPHNVGAVLRSAAAFGARAVVVQDRHAPDETGTLAKSASGALERVPMVRAVNLARALDSLKEHGFWIAGLAADAPATMAAAGLRGKVALVLGSEGEGMRRLVRERCDVLVSLPISDAVESLNVSNAAAVALYELVRA